MIDAKAIKRFLPKFAKQPGGCWEWQGSVCGYAPHQYGTFYYNGGPVKAHRFAHEAFIGPIPDGCGVCHSCDNPICVNPNHLFIGDQKANTIDCVQKGRANRARGRAHANNKLAERDVLSILEARDAGRGLSEIGREYGITPQAVQSIEKGRSWAWLTGRALL